MTRKMTDKNETQTATSAVGNEFTYDAYLANSGYITLRKWRGDKCIDTRYLQDEVSIVQFVGIILEDEREWLANGHTINDDHTQDAISDYFIDDT